METNESQPTDDAWQKKKEHYSSYLAEFIWRYVNRAFVYKL